MRRSKRVALVLLGTTGVIGLATAWDAWRHVQDDTPPQPAPEPAPPPLTTDQTYANNEYIPGVGYYHAPYHAWYPFPFNHHDPARGYYGGGLWQVAPLALNLLRSQPTNEAVVAGLAARRQREEEERRQVQTSGFRSTTSRFGGTTPRSGGSTARPATPTPSRSSGPSIHRGGFGGSSHSSGG